jgi:uncharacterized protein (TIGR02452 family)
MSRQEVLIAMAQETQLIARQGAYTTGSGELVALSNTTGPLSYLIRPDDWNFIIDQANQECLVRSSRRAALQVTQETTLAAIQRIWHANSVQHQGTTVDIEYHPTIMVLNFASGKHPGGGWLRGSEAQEESLARASDLVASQERWPQYYQANQEAGPLYTNHAIWSPGVNFFRGDRSFARILPYQANVLTIPAPKRVDMKAPDEAVLTRILKFRIECMFAQAVFCRQVHLVLGAWGCGVFGNDPGIVSWLFREQFDRWGSCFATVTFAIHDGTPDQRMYNAFEKAMA